MPRLKKQLTEDELFTAEQIKRDFGALLSVDDVMRYLGCSSRNTAKKFLFDVDRIEVNGRSRYMAVDIARKVEAGRVRA